jgi:eukaryotic-like serine/threonine-protein kinase
MLLSHAYGKGAELRAKVESLASGQRRRGAFIETRASLSTGSVRLPTELELDRCCLFLISHRRRSLNEGSRLGPYEIVRLLGRGGMGEVYLANDLELGHPAAIKVLPIEFGEQDRIGLRREARTAERLEHAGIAQFHQFLELDDIAAIVMEYVPGPTLRELLDEGALPAKKAFAIAVCLLEALAHAHGAGIVHRDVKPENIVVTGECSAKLLDFGVALQLQADPSETCKGDASDSRLTMVRGVVGTPGYISPEQLVGEAVDVRSDVFAVGAVLYEMLSGAPAFPGVSAKERLAATLCRDPSPLSIAVCPLNIQRIVMQALAKDPRRRFSSARDLLLELKSNMGARERRSARRPHKLAAAGSTLRWMTIEH